MSRVARRLAVLALLLLAVGSSVTVTIPGHPRQVEPHGDATSRLIGSDGLVNESGPGTLQRQTTRVVPSGVAKRHIVSLLGAVILGVLVVAVRRRRAPTLTGPVRPPLAWYRSQLTRAPPVSLLLPS